MIKRILVIACFICFLGVNYIFSQNVKNVTKVQESAARQIATQVREGNMSMEEAIISAKKEGFTDDQIQQGIELANQRNYFNKAPTGQDVKPTKIIKDTIIEGVTTVDKKAKGKEDKQAQKETGNNYFGYGLFTGAPGKFQPSQIGAADPNYIIGPGDEIIVSLWGEVEFRYSLTVSDEGTIFISNFGQVVVNGLTLEQLEKKLKYNLSKVYSGLNPPTGHPTTYLDVSLGKLKTFTVYITGHAKNPGSHNVSSYSTAFTTLYSVGGPTIQGSLRDIHIIRNNKVIANFDLYDFILTGKKEQEIRLQNNDVIFIPPRLSTITLKGEVVNPSRFELKENETVKDLIYFASGLKPTTDINRVQIQRIKEYHKRNKKKPIREVIDKDFTKIKDGKLEINPISLTDGDIVTVFSLKERLHDFVNIKGAVKQPGRYAISDKTTLQQLIEQADGFLPEAYRDKIDIVRTYQDSTTRYYSLDITKKVDKNFVLQEWDKIKVYSIWELKERRNVNIEGHVLNPGNYVYHDSMMVSDLLFKAGGLNDPFFWSQTYQKRADIVRYNEDKLTRKIIPFDLAGVINGNAKDIKLHPGDIVKVYNARVTFFPDVVSVFGEVKNPGQFEYATNIGIHDLLLQAGGFTRKAYQFKVEVYRLELDSVLDDTLSIVHSIDIKKGMLDRFSTSNDFQLQPFDLVVVRKDPEFELHKNVRIIGEVKFPGVFPILRKNEDFCSLISRAGGFTNEAFVSGIKFYRSDTIQVVGDFSNILKNDEECAIKLLPGDKVIVPKHPGTVTVEGEVKNPGLVYYRKGWSINRYIEAAGDFTRDAVKRKTVVFYPGGSSKRKGMIFHPKVLEGSRIYIPAKRERVKQIDWTSVITQWGSIATSFATVFWIVTRAN